MSDTPVTNAIAQLRQLIAQVRTSGESEASTAVLATADADSARPSVRSVYVHLDMDSVVFFVNTDSGKGHQLRCNPQAALCFFWRRLEKQVIVEGSVEELIDAEARVFWQHRPREAALAARVSSQQQVSDGPRLEDRLRAEKKRYEFARAERPANWIGYRLRPDRLVFWDTGWNRMRIRTSVQRLVDGSWEVIGEEP